MKADLRTGDGPEREELRAFLRQWDVPGPPAAIEDDLRREFRRKRGKGLFPRWLPLAAAAAVALLGVWGWGVRERAMAPAPPGPPVATASPLSPAALPSGAASGSATAAGSPPESGSATEAEGSRVRPADRAVRGPAARAPGRPAAAVSGVGRGAAAPREEPIVVEPGQGLLLAELGRALWAAPQAPPGTTFSQIEAGEARGPATLREAADVPRYGAHWETVEGEWPDVHRSRPGR